MATPVLSFVGGGNMARSLIGGLVADRYDATRIWVADPQEAARARLRAEFGVHTTPDNAEAARAGEVLVLAVKPQVLPEVARGLCAAAQETRPLVVSIAAGIRSTDIERWLGGALAVVRAMPNTPALVQSGATALFANQAVKPRQKDLAESILRAVGVTLWVEDEADLDTVTALSGSGPAYFFLFMDCLQNAAIQAGLSAEAARLLTLETALGASRMALSSSEPLSELRRRVTSPGGTTERALEIFEQGGFEDLVRRALLAAAERSRELADLLGSDQGNAER